MSEAHHRQMKLFAENGGKFISGFSSEFLKGYLDILRRQFGGKRVHSNVVYQEYIKDKEHIHMNATRWHTLTGLCMWLGKQGICKVDETEKGWYIEYIDRDPEKIKKQEVNERLEKTEDEYNRQFLRKFFSQSLTLVERQIEFNLSRTETEESPNYAPLVRPDESQPIRLNMSLVPKKVDPEESSLLTETQTTTTTVADSTDKQPMKLLTLGTKKPKPVNPLLEAEKKAREEKGKCASEKSRSDDRSGVAGSRRRALDELMQKEEASKDKRNRRDYWMTEGLEVKLVNKKLPDNIRLRHGAVVKMLDNYTAIVRVLNDGTKIKVDQEHVQTVIPPVSSTVLLVNGAYRGEYATLESVDKELCLCEVTIATGLCMGRLIKHVSLDDVCKLAERRLD
ncbi:Zinc finger protein RTS2 [Fasciola gigantica]|uniref:Zinc finger protein RTS2 n=1 Tax=Fasciola gigantica TaxID=46835 RepID=A0A504Y886_FASGI|nr:Zinc finger protein RTS2 [Fasciola gigantica]